MVNDFNSISKEWMIVKKRYGKDAYKHIPVPVIYSQSSADAEYITDELSSFAYSERILEKTNPRQDDYLFFLAPHRQQNEHDFSVVQELYNYIMSAGGYYGPYRGILLVDVSEWIVHSRNKYFDIFLSYLADQRMEGLIPFFCANCSDPISDMQAFEAVISSYFSSFRIYYGVEELYGYAYAMLTGEGILLSEGANHYLESFIRESMCSPLFHGTESIRHICESITHRCRSGQDNISLDESFLKEIITNLGCLDIYKDNSKKVIGFR